MLHEDPEGGRTFRDLWQEPHYGDEVEGSSQVQTKYRVANWPACNQALVRRGDVTVWLSSEAIAAWTPRRSGRRGGQRRYSDLAIETALTLRLLYTSPAAPGRRVPARPVRDDAPRPVRLEFPILFMTATLCGPGGVRAVIAEHLLLKQQLLVLHRPRQRAPHLTASNRRLFGFGSLFLSPGRIRKIAI